ncbi:hypothetical protein C5S36_05490, partial [Candidatus Methanophagaceae archaeon]
RTAFQVAWFSVKLNLHIKNYMQCKGENNDN